MDYAKLVYAAEVRKLAAEFRSEARKAFEAGLGKMPETQTNVEEIADLVKAWEDKYSVEYFLPKAIRQIDEVAKLLDTKE